MVHHRSAKPVIIGAVVAAFCPTPPPAQGVGQASSLSVDRLEAGPTHREVGPDLTFCQLYGLGQYGRFGDVVGLSIATTHWNIGDVPLPWFAWPDPNHPFMAQNLYRLKTVDGSERFEQIGQAWAMHGFCALSSRRCGGTCIPTGCNTLGVGCSDTDGAGIQASQYGKGPRYEVDPWTRAYTYPGSHNSQGEHEHDPVQHRLQVHDADLDPAQNPEASYYAESYYVSPEDIYTMNNAAWKPVTVNGWPGGTWVFSMTGSFVMPESGFAIDAWEGATLTVLAQELPVVEFESPDGRCVLAAKATDLGNEDRLESRSHKSGPHMWHYEYALLNVDMDRQVGSFRIPIAPGTVVTHVGFHAVAHHDERVNTTDPDGLPIDNLPWSWAVTNNAVIWSTTSNPLRWGTMYNFRFDAGAEPASTSVMLGLFRPGDVGRVVGATTGPLTPGVDLAGFAGFQNCFSGTGDPAPGCDGFDFEPDGDVDLDDYTVVILSLSNP